MPYARDVVSAANVIIREKRGPSVESAKCWPRRYEARHNNFEGKWLRFPATVNVCEAAPVYVSVLNFAIGVVTEESLVIRNAIVAPSSPKH